MISSIVIAHLVMALCAPILARSIGPRGYLVMALAPAVGFGWLLSLAPLVTGGGVYTESGVWIARLGVVVEYRVALLQWVLALIVTGVGALVLLYCRWYFDSGANPRTMGVLTAFAAAMLGLVTVDDLVLLYVFWELTTVFSYLLIGYDPTRRANRSAAVTALIVTTTGGLAMLVGIVTLGVQAGTFSLSAILATPPTGTLATIAALLMLVGALSKSALVPFHFWLPGAMAAPTPISAYLHAAAMVKAGVYLVAAMAPAFAGVPGWRPAVALLGATTMILGGWRALRQNDLKLLLAYGTVSQLGFMVLLSGFGTRASALAGMAMLIGHALFKSTLFLITGVIDHSAGTRDITRLTGLARQLPVVAVVAGVAAASMAGLPPTLGFIAKESALEALTYLTEAGGDGTGLTPMLAVLLLAAVVLGSVLTVAYTLRWWWGAFSDKADVEAVHLHRPSVGFVSAPVLLGTLCLVGGFAGEPLTALLQPYAARFATGHESHGLALWHGFTVPLWLSLLAIALGAVLFWQREAIARVQGTFPKVVGADELYTAAMKKVDSVAVEVTARTQRGSLASYTSIVLAVVVVLAGGSLLFTVHWPASIRPWDYLPQALIGALMIVAAVLAATSRGRLRALLLVGATGYGTALLFLLHGGPDLALTQVLVETVSLIVFVMVLRRLPKYFTNRPLRSTRWWRTVLAAMVGASVSLLALVAAGARVAEPVSVQYYEAAYSFGYGKNIVNVTLVDTRAWDTIGEISVLVIAATGVASLIFLRSRVQRVRPREGDSSFGARGMWLRASGALDPRSRSLIFEVVTRIMFSVLMLVSLYLLIAGHNAPGGGFAGGLVAGIALMIRYLAAGRRELDEAAPFDAGRLLGLGLGVSVLSAVAPALLGGKIFQSYDLTVIIPGWESLATPWGEWTLFGEMHLVSSTVFDIGVYLIVIGVVLDLTRSLGAGIDIQSEQDQAPVPEPESTRTRPALASEDDRITRYSTHGGGAPGGRGSTR
ncbi:Na+/H+ antiporter subunit A [Micropruina sonneratiae]|uniref:Na+/H+ antiporter subunit A n=1 Tax=Micropruina sonneratiae TaxID=2986940 RepID=UPI0022273937|nr:Na+/H+ antiporter subunit A [Micropruina sp. KQZ13P-5]MCW3158327.1 Na+/H+ antiporter subunit A [Micropruina sp. KQZ13P-5]